MLIHRASIAGLSIVLAAGAAHAQQMRASCDNRSGSTLADLSNSSGNPNTGNYNIDPSQLYITINNLSYPSTQTSGSNSASANLTVFSKFFGANPGTRITAFSSSVSGTASVTRSNLTASARSQDNTSICVNVSGASTTTPLKVRVVSTLSQTGAATTSFRFANPSNTNIVSLNGAGTVNRVINLTTNGDYTLQAQGDTTFLQLSSGTGPVTATFATSAAITCVADFNGNGILSVQDIFDYLNAWFANNVLAADTNVNGALAVQDIFDFLNAWFAGCV